MLHSVEAQRREWSSLSEAVRKVSSDLSARFCKKPRHLEGGGRRMVCLDNSKFPEKLPQILK